MQQLIEDAHLRTLSRFPDVEETEISAFIEESKTPADGVQSLLWALVNTKNLFYALSENQRCSRQTRKMVLLPPHLYPNQITNTDNQRVISMKLHRTCDGMQRRDMLKAGVLSLGGLTLSNYLQMAHAGQVQSGRADRAIFIELPGGPSHLDTFDMKPDATSEYRGSFNPIATNVPGIQISEHLPKLAAVADKFAILRGVSHTLAAHRLGREYVNTGSKPIPALEYPSYGSVLAKEQ